MMKRGLRFAINIDILCINTIHCMETIQILILVQILSKYLSYNCLLCRGEDTATLPVKVQIPELEVNIECEVDGADCGDVIEVNSKSFVTYIVTVYHT